MSSPSVYYHDGVALALPTRVIRRCALCGQVEHVAYAARRAPGRVKICIVSDSHDRADPLLAAVRAARRDGAQAVVHCGDVIGGHTLRPLLALDLPVHAVHGNNLGDVLAMLRMADGSDGRLVYHGAEADLVLGGRRVYVTHFPHQARGMACTGDYEVVCCGHSHEAAVDAQDNIRGSRTWLVNPGTVAGVGGAATWIFADLERLDFEVRPTPLGDLR